MQINGVNLMYSNNNCNRNTEYVNFKGVLIKDKPTVEKYLTRLLNEECSKISDIITSERKTDKFNNLVKEFKVTEKVIKEMYSPLAEFEVLEDGIIMRNECVSTDRGFMVEHNFVTMDEIIFDKHEIIELTFLRKAVNFLTIFNEGKFVNGFPMSIEAIKTLYKALQETEKFFSEKPKLATASINALLQSTINSYKESIESRPVKRFKSRNEQVLFDKSALDNIDFGNPQPSLWNNVTGTDKG